MFTTEKYKHRFKSMLHFKYFVCFLKLLPAGMKYISFVINLKD